MHCFDERINESNNQCKRKFDWSPEDAQPRETIIVWRKIRDRWESIYVTTMQERLNSGGNWRAGVRHTAIEHTSAWNTQVVREQLSLFRQYLLFTSAICRRRVASVSGDWTATEDRGISQNRPDKHRRCSWRKSYLHNTEPCTDRSPEPASDTFPLERV